MSWLQRIYYFFSSYTDSAERRVGKFFKRVREGQSLVSIEKSLVSLLQRDAAVVNLWTERRYKGYNYLTKRARRQLYRNLAAIKADFADFSRQNPVDSGAVLQHVRAVGGDPAQFQGFMDQLGHMAAIMRYLSPRAGRYQYRKSSSFGRLLRDPKTETMVGDCNQIVTLFIELYAQQHDVRDLKLVLLPGHVAIRFFGVDVETTNSTFKWYDEPEQTVVPVHEIISVNLLDTSDSNYAKGEVPAETFLQAARLAYVVSSSRELVKRNLDVAYSNTVRSFMVQKRYSLALDYARQSKNFDLIEAAAHNGAVHELKQKNYAAARRFAARSQKRSELTRTIDRSEAVSLFNSQKYDAARQIYERLGERDMVKRCWRGMYSLEQKKLGRIQTVADVKANGGVVRNMERYARASGDAQLIKAARALTKHL